MSPEYFPWLLIFGIFVLIVAITLKIKFSVDSGGSGIFGRLNKWVDNLTRTAEVAKHDVSEQFSPYISTQQLRFSNMQNRLMLEGTVDNVEISITFAPIGILESQKTPYQGVAMANFQLKFPSVTDEQKELMTKSLKEAATQYNGTVYKVADTITITFPQTDNTDRAIAVFERLKSALSFR